MCPRMLAQGWAVLGFDDRKSKVMLLMVWACSKCIGYQVYINWVFSHQKRKKKKTSIGHSTAQKGFCDCLQIAKDKLLRKKAWR